MSCPYAAPLAGDASTASTSSATSSPRNGPIPPHSGADNDDVMEALALAKSVCPAFRDGKGCPFRDATDTEAMKKAMLSVPPSHIEMERLKDNDAGDGRGGSAFDVPGKFRKALEHVHTVSVALHSPESPAGTVSKKADGEAAAAAGKFVPFMLDGGCPFKTYYNSGKSGEGGSSSSGAGGGTQVPFVSAMEEFSLSAIIARMADEESRDAEVEGKGEGGTAQDGDEGRPVGAQKAPVESKPAGQPTASQEQGARPERSKRLSVSAALQTGTAESHQAAEEVHFVRNFVKGVIDRDLYAALVLDLFHVYKTLEEKLDVYGPRYFPALHHPEELGRTASLEDDVEFFHGDDWERKGFGKEPSPATADYVKRMEFISATEPLLLLSHAYTRYLGDLSGGRILARVARRALNLKGSKDGLRFYEFEKINSPKKFKDGYRRELDELDLTPDQVARLVAEANVAFVLNMRIFEELDVKGGVEGSEVRPLEEATKYCDRVLEQQAAGTRGARDGSGGSTDGSSETKCPFAHLGGPNPHKKKADDAGTDLTVAAKAKTAWVPSAQKAGESATHNTTTADGPSDAGTKQGRCPWPFVFFHDPFQGMKDYQTWVVIGLILCRVWSTSRHGIIESLKIFWETIIRWVMTVAELVRSDDGSANNIFLATVLHLVLLIGAYGVTKAFLARLKQK